MVEAPVPADWGTLTTTDRLRGWRNLSKAEVELGEPPLVSQERTHNLKGLLSIAPVLSNLGAIGETENA